MAIALEDIIEELKVLPPDKLAAAASFIEDLKESEEELSVEWKQEIDKRLEDIRLGRVETIQEIL